MFKAKKKTTECSIKNLKERKKNSNNTVNNNSKTARVEGNYNKHLVYKAKLFYINALKNQFACHNFFFILKLNM